MRKQLYLSDSVIFDITEKKVFKDGDLIKLNAAEERIFLYFIAHKNEIVDKNQLLNAGWPNGYVTESSLFGVILSIRTKLGKDTITTVPRLGYRIKVIEVKVIKKNRSCIYFSARFISILMLLLGIFFFLRSELPTRSLNNNNELYALSALSIQADRFIQDLTHRKSNLNIYATSNNAFNSISWCNRTEKSRCSTENSITVQFYDQQLPEMLNHLAKGKLDKSCQKVSNYHGRSNYFASYYISFNEELMRVELDTAYEIDSDQGFALNVATLDTGNKFILFAQSASTLENTNLDWFKSEHRLKVQRSFFRVNEATIDTYFTQNVDKELLLNLTTRFIQTTGVIKQVTELTDQSVLWMFQDKSLIWVYHSEEAFPSVLPLIT